jgi:hypothetical protein
MTTEILVIGRNKEILVTLLRSINQNPGWNGRGAMQDEEAIELFHSRDFDFVLLSSGIEEESEKKLRSLFSFQNPDITIIQHYGGGSGLLSNEIKEAIDKRRHQRWQNIAVNDGGIQ